MISDVGTIGLYEEMKQLNKKIEHLVTELQYLSSQISWSNEDMNRITYTIDVLECHAAKEKEIVNCLKRFDYIRKTLNKECDTIEP